MASKIRRSLTAGKRIWGTWEVANSTKAVWDIVPKKIRDKWKAIALSLISGPLAAWWVSAQAWWSSNWGDVLAVGSIMLGTGLVAGIVAWRLDQRQEKPIIHPAKVVSEQSQQTKKERLIFLDPEVPEDPARRKAVEVVVPVRNERSLDALLCRVRIVSVISSSGRERRLSDHSLMWTTGREEEMIPPETTLRFQIARSYIPTAWIRRKTELVFGGGGTEILKLHLARAGGTFWISIELRYSNSKPLYGVYRLDSNKLHVFFDTEGVSESDVVQLTGQFDESPDLEQLIADYDRGLPESD